MKSIMSSINLFEDTADNVKEFRRFNKIGNGHFWTVSLDQFDSIVFEANKDVFINGIGIYGASDGIKHDF